MDSMDPIPLYTLKLLPLNMIVSPGLSSVPANRSFIIITPAPAAIAFGMSPEYLMPPSAITGIHICLLLCTIINSSNLWQSLSGNYSGCANRKVNTNFDSISSAFINVSAVSACNISCYNLKIFVFFFTALTVSITPLECPWAVSITIIYFRVI